MIGKYTARMAPNPAQLEPVFAQVLDLLEKVAARATDEEDEDDEDGAADPDDAPMDALDEDALVESIVEEAVERGIDEDKAERVFRAILSLTKK